VHDQQGVRKLVNDVLRRGAALALTAILVTGCTFAGGFGSPPPGASGVPATAGATDVVPTEAPTTAVRTPRPTPARTARPTATPKPQETPIPGLEKLLGSDGRLTILLLGVDSRTKQITGRTDAILFVTIDPNTGRVTMASLPRDMVLVPIGPGRTFGSGFVRINALLGTLSQGVGRKKGLDRMVKAMEYMSGIEIDRYAMIGFHGVRGLISIIGGVDVKLDQPLVDPSMHVIMHGHEGLSLRKGRNHLHGATALAFARTRHTDNDYERGRRQQQLIAAAITKVIDNGPDRLPHLLKAFKGRLITDFDVSDGMALLALAEQAKLKKVRSYVLGPSKFAGPGDMKYATALKIDVVRAMFRREFGPVD
jgi:LCP family protein required for cell wall assembly